jgi:hypothetical protein
VPVKNAQAQKTVKPVKLVSTANSVLKMVAVVGCVNNIETLICLKNDRLE